MRVWDAPRGPGAYGITTTPDGAVYFASLAGSYIARIDPTTGAATVIEPPTPRQGARRILVRLVRSIVGQRVPRGPARSFRPSEKQLAILASARRQGRALRGLCRSARPRVGERFRCRHIAAFRSSNGQFSRIAGQRNDVWIRQLLGRPGRGLGRRFAHDRLIRVTGQNQMRRLVVLACFSLVGAVVPSPRPPRHRPAPRPRQPRTATRRCSTRCGGRCGTFL